MRWFLRVAFLVLVPAACAPVNGGVPGPSGDVPGAGPGEPPSDTHRDATGGVDVPPGPLAITGVVAAGNPANVLSYYVVWRTDLPASTGLDVDCGDYTASVDGPGLRTDHEVFVMGLYPEAECVFTLRSVSADGRIGEAEAAVTVQPRPEILPPLEVTVDGGDAVQPGWTLFNLTNKYDGIPPIAAVVDAQGRYRWYHVRAASATGSGTPVLGVPGGILIGGSNDGGVIWPALIDWEGRVVWEEPLDMHHEILPWAGGEELLYLGSTETCPAEIPDSSTIVRYDPETQEVLWEWAFCEHFTPDEIVKDWDHTNAVTRFPDEDAWLISAKKQNGLFKVDPGTGEVVWRLGKGGDFVRTDGGTAIPFLRQHAPEFVGPDEVLLFDNGKETVREQSGAVQIRFDEEAMEYAITWSWYPDPPIFCHMWGDADRLENGNTLMAFGRRYHDKDSHLIEVDAAGTEVWHLRSPVKWGWYRADRIPPFPAGYVVAD